METIENECLVIRKKRKEKNQRETLKKRVDYNWINTFTSIIDMCFLLKNKKEYQ